MRLLESGVPLDAETYWQAFCDLLRQWSTTYLALLLDKIGKAKLLTQAELYDIFLPKN